MFKCMFSWTHQWSWPRQNVETCNTCGKTRPARVQFAVDPKLAVPRYEPTVWEWSEDAD
jgi:hypothetical protein